MTDLCVSCGQDISFGSGRFVNRVPAFGYQPTEEDTPKDGYLCGECQSVECAVCGERTDDYQIAEGLDDDVCVDCATCPECDNSECEWEPDEDDESLVHRYCPECDSTVQLPV